MELARNFDGKKFMWDGRTYDDEQEMKKVEQEYRNKGFEVQVGREENRCFLFSRRVVTEVVVEGTPI